MPTVRIFRGPGGTGAGKDMGLISGRTGTFMKVNTVGISAMDMGTKTMQMAPGIWESGARGCVMGSDS